MQIINLKKEDLKAMNELWNEVVTEDYFYKPLSFDEYQNKLLNNPDFSFDTVFGIKDNDKLVAYIIGYIRQMYKDNLNVPGYVNMVVVKREYRHQGIGSSLLKHLENYFKQTGRKFVQASYYLPSCYSWYIPNTKNHDHPCAPAIRINSNEYFFLLHRGYSIIGQEDAFHLDLSDYEISEDIQKILDEAKKEGITIELYDKNKHYGLEEFYKELNIYDFEKVIRSNLELEHPYPFLVVAKDNKVVGWTGAMWNEESGRGHFDGIAILSSVRGRGLGKALFSLLAYYNKKGGAKFMTFYTGLTNHARYIYMGAGFKIIESFALMKKELK
ncbi:MAG: GNAT family N-acetyltransferase [Acholeplasmataceae bacterium]|nr:GNAT family N-acetyltransferase [Acholeplasmataceae bacterium]